MIKMAELPVTSYGRKVIGEKSRLISLLMNFFIPGLGIIYAGKLKQGLIFFICSVVLILIDIFLWIPLCGASLAVDGAALAAANVDPSTLGMANAGAIMAVMTIFLIYMIIAVIDIILIVVTMVIGWKLCTENNTLLTEFLESK